MFIQTEVVVNDVQVFFDEETCSSTVTVDPYDGDKQTDSTTYNFGTALLSCSTYIVGTKPGEVRLQPALVDDVTLETHTLSTSLIVPAFSYESALITASQTVYTPMLGVDGLIEDRSVPTHVHIFTHDLQRLGSSDEKLPNANEYFHDYVWLTPTPGYAATNASTNSVPAIMRARSRGAVYFVNSDDSIDRLNQPGTEYELLHYACFSTDSAISISPRVVYLDNTWTPAKFELSLGRLQSVMGNLPALGDLPFAVPDNAVTGIKVLLHNAGMVGITVISHSQLFGNKNLVQVLFINRAVLRESMQYTAYNLHVDHSRVYAPYIDNCAVWSDNKGHTVIESPAFYGFKNLKALLPLPSEMDEIRPNMPLRGPDYRSMSPWNDVAIAIQPDHNRQVTRADPSFHSQVSGFLNDTQQGVNYVKTW